MYRTRRKRKGEAGIGATTNMFARMFEVFGNSYMLGTNPFGEMDPYP